MTERAPGAPVANGRSEAVLAVLRGASVAQVAESLGVGQHELLQWVELFCQGGEERLAEGQPLEPAGRDRFLTLIAHEFRTPLSIIAGWVDLLSAQPTATEAGGLLQEALPPVRRQVAHLERVARDALDAGAAARGQLRLLVGPLKLRSLVEGVLMSMHDTHLVLLPGPEVEVVGDASRLEQVVGGLLEHARRLADDGEVVIELAETGNAHATMRASVEGRELSISDAAALLEPYARADTSFGTGLGLYLCRALLVAHGGEIGLRAESRTTVFWFSLPKAGPDASRLVQRG
jgi:signal transduction histidine kinase